MYSACIYCRKPLGANEAVERFPVGRRLAFDPARGRLWVVCGHCARWNLSPFETRWEAIEACERLFRDTGTRFSTEQIGLARLPDGTELVRIGRPRRPEFAAWRYGGNFQRRYRQQLAAATRVSALSLGIFAAAGPLLGSAVAALYLGMEVKPLLRALRGTRVHVPKDALVAAVSAAEGGPVLVTGRTLPGIGLVPVAEGPERWKLVVQHSGGRAYVAGDQAVHALALMLPAVNHVGGSARRVRGAVAWIEESGGPETFFADFARRTRPLVPGGPFHLRAVPLTELAPEPRLALEMAANEETERRAMEGELKLLESAWREAERIAAIADRLAIPGSRDAVPEG